MITGRSIEHAGARLIFYEYNEGVFQTKNKVFEISPDSAGYFSSVAVLEETKFLFADEGSQIYYFYAEPGGSYILTLPKPREKTLQEKKNPFFIPEEIHLPVKCIYKSGEEEAQHELNNAIRKYDELFNPFYDRQLLRYIAPVVSRVKLDSFLIISNELEEKYNNDFFRSYTFYKKGLLEFTTSEFNMQDIIERYFVKRPVLTSNPAYWELFNTVFDNYFSFLTVNPFYKELHRKMADGKYSELKKLLLNDPVLQNDTIRELVLIHELNNEFNAGNISASSLISILDSIQVKSASAGTRELALIIKNKNTRLMPGSPVPDLWLTDIRGNVFNVADIKGKLIYLGFCHPELRECQKEFEYLKHYQNAFSNKLLIITAVENVTEKELSNLAEIYNYQWTLAVLNDSDKAFNDYNVKGMPFFYLIGPDNRFLISPAGLPSSGFEKTLYQMIRE